MTHRIAIVGYVNARPLTDRIDRERFDVVEGHPSVVAAKLANGEVDVALCPVAAVLTDAEYEIVPGWCIGSEGPVTSVLLVAETPPEEWTRVVLDGVSRTSVVLAQLLLRQGPLSEHVRADLEVVEGTPEHGVDDARGTVASVVIGDVARALPERLTHRVDLAESWKQWTGLPFVFAVWAARPGATSELVAAIRDAGARGTASLASDYAGADLPYVRDALRYPLDDRALMGLRRFAALAHAAGLVGRDDVSLVAPRDTYRARPDVGPVLLRAQRGERLDRADALALFDASLTDLGLVADMRRQELHPGDVVHYGLRATGAALGPLVDAGAAMVSLSGALSPERVRSVTRSHPGVRVQGGLAGDDLTGLADAGLDRVHDDPVGLLSDPTRFAAMQAWWQAVHAEGLQAVATLIVGQGETIEERVDTLLALRAVQDELGVFAAARVWAAFGDGPAGSEANTAIDHLRAVAVARLVLDNIPSLHAAPDTEGLGMSQASLRMGCDHMGWLSVEDADRVPALISDVEHHIGLAGFTAVREVPEPPPVRHVSGRGAAL